jgi:hypothetical protein
LVLLASLQFFFIFLERCRMRISLMTGLYNPHVSGITICYSSLGSSEPPIRILLEKLCA